MLKYVPIILAILAIVALGYLFMNNEMPTTTQPMMRNSNSPMSNNFENFTDVPAPAEQVYVRSGFDDVVDEYDVDGSEAAGSNEQHQSVGDHPTDNEMNELPSECYPKDVLSSADLLPRDANSLWAKVSPSGQGSLADQNFLTSGFHIGINTVGQTLRNANRQLRSEPLNPQVKVSPWMQTTIDPDINRRPLEINSGEQ